MKKREKINFSLLLFIKKDKRGTILVENIIFIILNLLFLTVLVLFLVKQGSGAIVLEESYSKQIALIVDSARPVMLIKLDMEKGQNIAEDNGIDFNDVVNIDNNIVTIRLGKNKGYSYSFFNDVEVVSYAEIDDKTGKYTGMYVFTINKKVIENE
jgi:hypothetical protein